jgi:diaminopimelate epimerase
MKIQFTKMHGLGNDFVVIDATHQQIELFAPHVRKLADRHLGIGFDQLLLIEHSKYPDIDFSYRIFNADGGEVAQCGNGARCLARFIRDKHLSEKNIISVATHNTVLRLFYEKDDQISAALGVPQFDPKMVPIATDEESLMYSLFVAGEEIKFCALSVGNPHAIIVVNDVQKAPVSLIGAAFAKNEFFPEGVNVNFMQVVNRHHIKLRVFERGVGETRACGSGACASVVAGQKMDLLDENVQVSLLGGDLSVAWKGDGEEVFLKGDAVNVFEGVIEI